MDLDPVCREAYQGRRDYLVDLDYQEDLDCQVLRDYRVDLVHRACRVCCLFRYSYNFLSEK